MTTVFLSGPITGVHNYREVFGIYELLMQHDGYHVLSPTMLPEGHSNDEYMRVLFPMINMADMVLALPGWEQSRGACLEKQYCLYTNKKWAAFDEWQAQERGTHELRR